MGMTLGLLGGGGSILAVPILIYGAGVTTKSAIAMSLLVVGATSALIAVRHASTGLVRWRTGLVFAGFAMVGAFAGGHLSVFFSGPVLLLLFVAMMAAAGVAMLRPRGADVEVRPPAKIWRIAVDGLVVGAATGLVGAGGGFLVVPALVFLGGLDMRSAVATSALVISLKSLAGFAGHAAHVAVDVQLVSGVIGFAVLGALIGSAQLRRVDPTHLRRTFGAFILAMAAIIFWQEAPPTMFEAIFVERWPFWAGGAAIGAFVLLFFAATNKALGVSTGFYDACAVPFDPEARRSWRLPFLAGIVGGGVAAALLAGGIDPTVTMGSFDTAVSGSLAVKASVFTLGGVMLGFGARLAGGCTSGHGIVGMSLMARSSIVATSIFMVTGIVVTHLIHQSGG